MCGLGQDGLILAKFFMGVSVDQKDVEVYKKAKRLKDGANIK